MNEQLSTNEAPAADFHNAAILNKLIPPIVLLSRLKMKHMQPSEIGSQK